jgi:hypothetical protein
MQALPTQTEKLMKHEESQKESEGDNLKTSIIEKYGGAEHLQVCNAQCAPT